ncbi:MAG: aldehyde ferredoxin oxidoreductase [Gammaproteobacteria bacterium]|nr:aldehyde ferredoxin oxidoreductase [Gammaproteobacteria bacterium]
MRTYHDIDLSTQTIDSAEVTGESLARCGRYLIAKTLLEQNKAKVDPLSADNPLIFSAGPFAGTNFSNANRVSVGCKSPLTGGIKEANGGGTFGFAMGQLQIAGFTLHNASDDWVIIRMTKEGDITFEDASDYMGMGNFETAAKLHERYGKKVSIGLCSLVGEYQGLLSGISFSDVDLRPSRLAARGGVGAVMGSKKVKAIVLDLNRMPAFNDRKKVMGAVKEYKKMLDVEPAIKAFQDIGTAMVADYTNHVGGLPVNNFSLGRQTDTNVEVFRMGGDALREQNIERGGETTHACMPGCIIQCSNVYADKDGKEVVSPVEYETIGLLGTNCGLKDPDELAELNWHANDLGIDTIELGGMIGVLMDAGKGEFGNAEYMQSVLDDIRAGNENGRLYAQGTAAVGEHFNVSRIPVIKRQAISAYDPRVIEVTGLTMMMTAQGADHTAGNIPQYDCKGKDIDELVAASLEIQTVTASADSLGLCIFGRSVTNTHVDFLVNAINEAHGVELEESFFKTLGQETLELEAQFNAAAGFDESDDELPAFFYDEALPPSDQAARFHSGEVKQVATSQWEKIRQV